MKRIINKIKSATLFAKLMFVYVVIVIGILTGFCIWEWDVLAEYQADYDRAEAAAAPELFLEEYVTSFTEEKYREILKQSLTLDSDFYTVDMLTDYEVENNYVEGQIHGEKNEEKYADNRPVYDIYAGDKKIAVISLGIEGKDEYGFNKWKEGTIEIVTDLSFDEEAEFIADNTMTIEINGQTVSKEYVTGQYYKDLTSDISKLMNVEYVIEKYRVTGLMEGYELKVCDATGTEMAYATVEEVRDYTLPQDENERKAYEERIDEVVKTYINYTSRNATAETMLSYTDSQGEAYNIIQNSVAEMIWVTRPESIRYDKTEISNIRLLGGNIFVCDIHYEISKTYEDSRVSKDHLAETVEYRLIFKKINDVWLLEGMSMQS